MILFNFNYLKEEHTLEETRRKKSVVWEMDKSTLEELVKNSSTFKSILDHFHLRKTSGNYRTLKRRLISESIDFSHIEILSKEVIKTHLKTVSNSRKKSLEEILVADSSFNSKWLKIRLISEGIFEDKCSMCGIGNSWNGKPLVLQLDHINGDHSDNRLENLRIVCPNCHTQTNTFSGKQKKLLINVSHVE
jgi:hypothetical protein